ITNNFMLSQAKSPLTHVVVLFGPALVIVDAELEMAILNNMIFGDVRFYGTQGAFTQEDFDTKVAQPVVDGTLVIDLQADGGDARIEGNSLTRLTVDQDILSNLSTDTPPKFVGLFRRMSLLNNTIQPRSLNAQGFLDPYSCVQWLGAHVISNGNYFILPASISELILSVGSAAAASFICVGTSSSNLPAGRDYLLYTMPNVDAFRESANLIALIPFNPTPLPRPILPPPRPPLIPGSVSPKRKRKAPRPKPG